MNCNNCKNWNTIPMWGCKCFIADTGEVLHYYENAETKCKDFDEK